MVDTGRHTNEHLNLHFVCLRVFFIPVLGSIDSVKLTSVHCVFAFGIRVSSPESSIWGDVGKRERTDQM